MGLIEGGDAVAGHAHVIALHAQRALEHLRDRVVILDDENAGRTFEIRGHVHDVTAVCRANLHI